MFTVSIELKYYLIGCMKLPMNVDIYSIAFDFETIWRIVGGATGTRATNIKRPLGGLSNLFIFISGWSCAGPLFGRCVPLPEWT